MKSTLWPTLAIAFSFAPGNFVFGQDDAAPEVTTGYSAQGNVAMNKAQHEAETQRAVLAARQTKALKEAMAAYAVKTPVITTSEQFLAAHRPPAPQNTGGEAGMSPVKTSTYVPEFEAPGITREQAAQNAGAVTTEEGASRRVGFFDRLKARKTANEPAPPASTYTQPDPNAAAAAAPTPSPADVFEATAGAPAKSSFLGRLFGKDKKSQAAAIPRADLPPAPATDPEMSAGTSPPSESGIPTPPSFTGVPVAPVPAATGTAPSIFRQTSSSGGQTSTLKSESQATVEGVLVRLYEGTAVEVLSRDGDVTTIRLPDKRVGTISSSALSQ